MFRLRTRVALFSATTLAATTAVAALAMGSSSATAGSPTGNAAPTAHLTDGRSTAETGVGLRGVSIKGAVEDRGPITRAQLAALPQHNFTAHFQTAKGSSTHTYSGPLLLDVLKLAKPNFGPSDSDVLRYVILVKATDGFTAALSWGEIEPKLENKHVMLALVQDGKQVTRPGLVVPRDHFGGRYVYDISSISLLRLSASMANGDAGKVLDYSDHSTMGGM
jgi:hypothetical protein